jgi:hypothetical protein
MIMWIIMIIGACGLMALVLWLTIGHKGGDTIIYGMDAAKNLTGALVG